MKQKVPKSIQAIIKNNMVSAEPIISYLDATALDAFLRIMKEL